MFFRDCGALNSVLWPGFGRGRELPCCLFCKPHSVADVLLLALFSCQRRVLLQPCGGQLSPPGKENTSTSGALGPATSRHHAGRDGFFLVPEPPPGWPQTPSSLFQERQIVSRLPTHFPKDIGNPATHITHISATFLLYPASLLSSASFPS